MNYIYTYMVFRMVFQRQMLLKLAQQHYAECLFDPFCYITSGSNMSRHFLLSFRVQKGVWIEKYYEKVSCGFLISVVLQACPHEMLLCATSFFPLSPSLQILFLGFSFSLTSLYSVVLVYSLSDQDIYSTLKQLVDFC